MNPIQKLAALARREHEYDCSDRLVGRDGHCGCGADERNAQVGAVLAELGEVRLMYGDGRPEFFSPKYVRGSRSTYLVVEIIEPTGEPGDANG